MSSGGSLPHALRPQDVATIHDVALRLSRRLRKRSGSPLTHSQFSALSTLGRHGQMRVGDLARREHITQSSVTRIVANLERQGFLVRETDPGDRRSYLVSISEPGQELLDIAKKRANEFLASEIERLSIEDQTALLAAVPALEHLMTLSQQSSI